MAQPDTESKEVPLSRSGERWLNRTVIGASATSFFSDLSHETATAVLPAFLASIGAPPVALGVIEGAADGASSFAKMWSGWFSDRVGRRKPLVVLGYVLTSFTQATFALATIWWHILPGRVIGWLGRGLRSPPRDALLADAVPPAAVGKAFGLERAGDTLGAVLGPLLALLLLSLGASYRTVFAVTLIPGVLAVLSFLVLVKDRRRAPSPRRFWQAIRHLPLGYRFYLLGVGLFGLGDFAHTLLIFQATKQLSERYSEAQAGQLAIGLYVVHNIVYAAANFPVGALSDRIGRGGLLVAGYALAGVTALGFAFASPNLVLLGLLFAAAGLYVAIEDTLEKAVVADLVPRDLAGTGYGLLATVNGLGDLAASMIVGALWTVVGVAAGFAYTAALAFAGAVVIAWAFRYARR